MTYQARKARLLLKEKKTYIIHHQISQEVFGFQLFDKVLFENPPTFIGGKRSNGYFHLTQIDRITTHNYTSYPSPLPKGRSLSRRHKGNFIQKLIKLPEKATTLSTTTGGGVSSSCLKT